jgi:hypothetical protein
VILSTVMTSEILQQHRVTERSRRRGRAPAHHAARSRKRLAADGAGRAVVHSEAPIGGTADLMRQLFVPAKSYTPAAPLHPKIDWPEALFFLVIAAAKSADLHNRAALQGFAGFPR